MCRWPAKKHYWEICDQTVGAILTCLVDAVWLGHACFMLKGAVKNLVFDIGLFQKAFVNLNSCIEVPERERIISPNQIAFMACMNKMC